MKLQPYAQVDETSFTATSEDIVRSRGQPWRSQRNGVGLNELDYGDVVYRFEDNGRLEEITKEAEVLMLGNVAVRFEVLADFIRAQDPEAFARAGFLVSPEFGLAFDPAEPFWVTALARHAIAQWQAL